MSAYGKYRIIEADTPEERKRHRQFVEEKLQKDGLNPAIHMELDAQRWHAIADEECAREPHANNEEAQEDKENIDEGSQTDSASGGKSSSGGGGGIRWNSAEVSDDVEGDSDFEVFALLFLQAEADTVEMQQSLTPASSNAAMAASTLVYDRIDNSVLVNEPYVSDPNNTDAGGMLHAMEHHALSLGARTMYVNVHADAVEMFRNKGYVVHGKTVQRSNVPLQRMRKILTQAAMPRNVVT